MAKTIDVRGTVTLGVKAPRLKELKTRPCSLEELQSALVQLIELFNEEGERVADALNKKADKEWRATI